jgi:hypothetical protein
MEKKKVRRDEERIVLFDHKDLAMSVEHILKGGPQATYLFGQLLVSFNRALDSGPRGLAEMRKALATSLEAAYLNSTVYSSALELCRLSLEGKLKSGDEPAALIEDVIVRNRQNSRFAATICKIAIGPAQVSFEIGEIMP